MSLPGSLPREDLLGLLAEREAQVLAQNERILAQDAQITAMAAQLSVLVEANEELTAKLARVEHLLSRNSANSSCPPSKDDQPGRKPPKAKPPRGSGRKKGKQPGTPGSNLSWTETPDANVDSFPEGRCECGSDLTAAIDLGVVDRYQQHEIPQVRVAVTQYDQHAVVCACGNVHTAPRPEGARAGRVGYGPNLAAFAVYLMVVQFLPAHRVVDLLESLTGAAPSVGFVHGMLERTATALEEVDAHIRTLITLAHVVCADETPLRVGPANPAPGKTKTGRAKKKAKKKAERYLLVACTPLLTYYHLGDRDLDTFKAFVLPELTAAGAVLVHDRYVVYDNPAFAGLLHQLCCAHLLRDLATAAETYPEELWPVQIADALRGLIHETNLARAAGATVIDPDRAAPLFKALTDGVKVGLSATTSHGDRPGERKSRLVLECLRDRRDDVLRFTTDLRVPATSNGAERDLRPSKVQQNISGRLTSEDRTKNRYRIRGYISTAVKHGADTFHVLRRAICGNPWMPPDPAPA